LVKEADKRRRKTLLEQVGSGWEGPIYREGKVGGNDFRPKKRIKEEGKIY
jgi:hypothetical protein